MIHKSWLLVVLGSACAILLTACEAGSGGGGGGGDNGGSDNGNANLNDNADTGGNTNDNSSDANPHDHVDGGTDGNDNAANVNANDNTQPPTDGNVNDNTTDNVNANDNTTGGGGGGGGGATDTITPGSGVAGIVLEQSTAADVEALLGAPDGSAPGAYTYVSLGIYLFFNDQNVVDILLVGTPYAGKTPGGNGIGDTLAEFRAEFGSDDVLDTAQNFRVWEADGIAARFDSTSGLAVGIQILQPT